MRENTLGCIAYEYLKQKAETGDQEAQYNLALYYKQSLCTPMNLTESLKWMFQSAQKGHIKAQYELGQYHMKLIGQELIKDSEGNVYDAHAIQARFWYKSSAEKGLKEAQSKLGFCYIHAIGGSEDLDKAFFWFQKSALQNEPFALYALGVFNLLGYKEHTKDIEKAKEYCRFIALKLDAIPVCPHIYFTRFLDDNNEIEREVGMSFGLRLLSECDNVYVFDSNGISEGMKKEIELASKLNIPVAYESSEVFKFVK